VTNWQEPWSKAKTDTVQVCLAKMLETNVFAHAERQKRLLAYLVSQTLAGHGNRLKGYTIAIDVFDRNSDFDPAVEPIVRVETARLRTKLREYYAGEGRLDPVRIEIPKGAYLVRICDTADARPVEADAVGKGEKPSLAVLPFANMSDDPGQDYFVDGIVEDLTTDLSKLSGLVVISRHSAFAYKNTSRSAGDIARELGVRYLVEGSVRRDGQRVRIAAHLIDSTSGTHLWADRYDRDLKDIFAVQDEVAQRIVKSLQVKLVGIESDRLGHEGTSSLEAHDLLLRGLERLWHYSREAAAEAQAFFAKAVALDPDYAAAHAWLARSYVFQWAMNWIGEDSLEVAYEHAKMAVAFDDNLPLGHTVLGWVQMWRKEANEAVSAGRHAVVLDPNNADAQLFLSITLSALGRGKESLNYIRSAIRLNPHPSTLYLMALGVSYYVLGQFEEAIEAFQRGVELSPLFPPNQAYLAITYLRLERKEEALAAWRSHLTLTNAGPCTAFWIEETLRTAHTNALERLDQLIRR
jgi:adenylate cyclase